MREDGVIEINDQLNDAQAQLAKNTLKLVGLDKRMNEVTDENGLLVAIDRVAQRMQAWSIALDSKLDLEDLEDLPTAGMRRQVCSHGTW